MRHSNAKGCQQQSRAEQRLILGIRERGVSGKVFFPQFPGPHPDDRMIVFRCTCALHVALEHGFFGLHVMADSMKWSQCFSNVLLVSSRSLFEWSLFHEGGHMENCRKSIST